MPPIDVSSLKSKMAETASKARKKDTGDTPSAAIVSKDASELASTEAQGAIPSAMVTPVIIGLEALRIANKAADANSVIVLVNDNDLQKELKDLRNAWLAQLPRASTEQKAKKEFPPHPMGGDRHVVMFTYFLDAVANDSAHKAEVRSAATALLIEPSAMALYVTDFAPKHKTPKDGRKWVWRLTISFLAPPDYVRNISLLVGVSTTRYEIVIPHTGQTQKETKTWDRIKKK